MSRWSVLLGATAAIVIASISTTGCKNGGGADNLGFFFSPTQSAAISSVIPNSGSILGGNSITIIGSNFGPSGATVTIGAAALTSIAQPNTSTITGIIPTGNYPVGPASVTVVTSASTAILANGYTFEDMTFTSITPNTGPISGNVPVVIRGTNFKDVPLSGVVLQATNNSGVQAQLQNVVVNATFDTINAIVPSGLPLGTYNLIVTSTSHGTKNFGAVYTVGNGASTTMLIIDIRSQPGNVAPANGPLNGGTTVTLTADLTAPSPAGFVGAITVSMVFPGGQVLSGTNVSVAANKGSLTFTTPDASSIFFGGPVTIRVDSSTQGFALAANGFTYNPVTTTPVINAISPSQGPEAGGTVVTLQGFNYLSGAVSNVRRVLFGGNPGVAVSVQSTTQLQVTTPPGIAGSQPVVIESTTGALSNTVSFFYQASIVITSVDPAQGPLAGGIPITIHGANFTTATVISGSITINGKGVGSLAVINSGTLTGLLPSSTFEGPVDVVAAANGGLFGGTLRQGFTYGPSFDPPGTIVPGAGFVPNATPVSTLGLDAQALALGSIETVLDGVIVNSGPDNSMTLVTDIASLGSGSGSFTVANGSGAIGGASPFNNAIDVKVADMTGPGSQDIVVLNNGTGAAGGQSVVVIKNNHDTTFTVVGTFATNTLPGFGSLQAVSIDVGDVNQDGHPDVAVLGSSTTAGTSAVGIFNGSATGALAAGSSTVLGATESGAVKVRIVGPGTAQVSLFTSAPPVDMNSDGRPDIVTLCKASATVSILAGDGAGNFSLLSTTAVNAVNPVSFDLGDIDDSGTIDIVTVNQGSGTDGSVSVLVGNGAGVLAPGVVYTAPNVPKADFSSIILGDFNFDCRLDAVVGNLSGANISVFIGDGQGAFSSSSIQYVDQGPTLTSTAKIVALAGIQRTNGLDGVVCLDQQTTGTQSFVTLVPRHVLDAYLGGFAATNPVFQASSQGVTPDAVALGDLNGDSRIDMVVANRATNNIQVYIGDGTGNFTQPFAAIPLVANAQPESVLIARVDNTSSLPSVLVACSGLNSVALLRNFGGGSLGNPIYIPIGVPVGSKPDMHQLLVVDMNGDGKPDVITVNQSSNTVALLLGDGTGNFTPAASSPYPVNNGPLSAAVADLDGDGSLDIAVANNISDDVTLMLTKTVSATDVTFNFLVLPLGGPIPTNPTFALTGAPFVTRNNVQPRSIAVGDLNGDGAPDIVTADGAGTCTILYAKQRARLTLTNYTGVPVGLGDVLQGGPIGLVQGNSFATGAKPYKCVVTNIVSVSGTTATYDVTDITGGGIPLSGDPQFLSAVPASPLVPSAFFRGDNIRDANQGNALVGNVASTNGLVSVKASGHFFLPSDYFSDGTLTHVGNPTVIIPVGNNPCAVKLFDMNNDGFLDLVVGLEDDSKVATFISQAEANLVAFGTNGLLQTVHNTPFGAVYQLQAGALIGGPNSVVSPSGEVALIAADKTVYGLQDFPSSPHNGYPIRLNATPPIAGGAEVTFSTSANGHVLAIDVAHVTLDCPPSIAVVTDNNVVQVFKSN